MKRFWIFILLLLSPYLIWVFLSLLICHPDKGVYEVSRPLAEAVVRHVQKHGKPVDLQDVENLPYELKPCSQKPRSSLTGKTKDFFCKDYYFEEEGKYYTVYFEGLPAGFEDKHYIWMDLYIESKYTVNKYKVFSKGNVKVLNDLKVHSFRSPIGICAHFSF